jgi:predicted nucleic acid-binding protein
VTIVDTSVWIEFFAASESVASRWVAGCIGDGASLVVPEVVLMELLIGTTDEQRAAVRRRLVQRFVIEPMAPVRDAEDAAAIHRRCRRGGHTIRSLIDCQVAAMALRLDLPVAHRDRDFDAIRTCCGLRTLPLF